MTREEAIKIIEDVRAVVLCNGKYDNAMRMAIEALKAKPVKHGQWIVESQSDAWEIVYCTECGEGMWSKKGDHLPNFCYNCGAKTDLDEVENG